jgi:glutathione S-transferase
MDMVHEDKGLSCPPNVAKDLARIDDLWTDARRRYGRSGPFLFGKFSAADAMFAPVISRIRTYGPVKRFAPLQDYMAAVWNLPAMEEWREGARKEAAEGWYD